MQADEKQVNHYIWGMTLESLDEPSSTSVLIVGAGPTGLALACDLARREVPFRIIEAAATPFLGSRGKGLQPRTLEVLEDLGVIDDLLASGGEYPAIHLHWWGRFTLGRWRLQAHVEPSAEVPYPNTWMVPQWRTEEILRARLAALGHGVELGTRLVSFDQGPDVVTATIARAGSTERVRAAYLVGADGGRSTVRGQLGISFLGSTAEEERMVLADVEVSGLDRDRWHLWPLAKGGALALCPLPCTAFFQLTAKLVPGAAAPPLTEQGIADFVTRAIGAGAGVRVHSPRWTSLWRYNARMVDRYRVERVFLAGDAAHVHPPTGGQGLNTGIQDAYNLGWKLAQVLAGAPEALLATYEAERLPIAAAVLGVSTRLYTQMSKKSALGQRRGPETQQLGLHYRGGALSRELRAQPGAVRAGDRAPDARGRDAAGKPVRLFDAFRGPHFTLLGFGAGHADAAARIAARHGSAVRALRIVSPGEARGERDLFLDERGQARAAYDVSGDALVLVRPDGYVGLFAAPGSVDEIEAYLGQCQPAARSQPCIAANTTAPRQIAE